MSYYEKYLKYKNKYSDLFKKIEILELSKQSGGSKNNLFINLINEYYLEMLRSRKDKTKHLFFDSILWWKRMYKDWSSTDNILKDLPEKYDYNPKIDLSILTPLDDCKFIPKEQLSRETLETFYKLLTTAKSDYVVIQEKCHEMTEYALPATIKSLESWKKYDLDDAINVMILGAGPVGLFTALYLNEYYNVKNNFNDVSFRKINIILVENRIKEEGLKLPYSRSTQFSFHISEFQQFLKFVSCWNLDVSDIDMRIFDYIHVLENMLYTVAYNKKIPMMFTKKFDDYKVLTEFIKTEKIHMLFDCTGGRSNIPDTKMISWRKIQFSPEGNQEVKLNKETNYFEFYEDGKVYTKSTCRIQLFDKDNKEFLVGNIFVEPTEEDDIVILNKYKNKCFSTDDYISLSSAFKQTRLRQLFPLIVKDSNFKINEIKSVKINMFYSIARHSPFAAMKMKNNCILVRLGDSLGGTEYGIHFGMKHSIEFSRHICHLMSSFL